jgi:hypothetical protein
MKIEVTADDIAEGVPEDGIGCPIACALNRLTGDRYEVDYEEVTTPDGRVIDLPPEARAFIRRFDRGDEVAPFTFELPLEG